MKDINHVIRDIQNAIKVKYELSHDEHVSKNHAEILINEAKLLEGILKDIQEHALYEKILEDQIDFQNEKLKL